MNKSLKEYAERFKKGENPTKLMNEMESTFAIPPMNNDEYTDANAEVIELYRKIANSRDL